MFFQILAASWWEPGSTDMLDVGDVSAILIFLIALVGAWRGLTKWWAKELRTMVREIVVDVVGEYTKPIQPDGNGGYSLPDVVKELRDVKASVVEVARVASDTKTTFYEYLAQRAAVTATNEDTITVTLHESSEKSSPE